MDFLQIISNIGISSPPATDILIFQQKFKCYEVKTSIICELLGTCAQAHISSSRHICVIGANEVRAHARLRARADVVATKLGIILLFLSFFPHNFLPEGVCLGSCVSLIFQDLKLNKKYRIRYMRAPHMIFFSMKV